MHHNFKRALAFAALAPFAFVGMTGSAVAAVAEPDMDKTGNIVTASCEHPDLPNFGWVAVITLEGDGTGTDRNDIERVRVYASDNNGVDELHDASAHVSKMQVKYYSENTNINLELLGTAKPTYDKTYSGNGVSSDGRQTFAKEKNNVGFMTIKVSWSKAGPHKSAENLKCTVPIRAEDF